jgi:hypothetical protein
MDQLMEPPIADDTLDEQLAADDADGMEDAGAPAYVPDPRILWAQEEARAMIVVLTRRLGPDFAREVHNELSSRLLSYQAGCPDDQRDGDAIKGLICDKFWDGLFTERR